MLIISSREFRDNQKKYFDLVDQTKEQIIVQRGANKSYKIVPISQEDLYFTPEMLKKLEKSIKQSLKGELVEVKEKDLDHFLGLDK